VSLLGTRLGLRVGRGKPAPAPATLIELLDRVSVVETVSGYCGFRILFWVPRGRGGPAVPSTDLLRPFNRVILTVTLLAVPTVLVDGFITHLELVAGANGLSDVLSVTGEDGSVMMDLEEAATTYPGQADWMIANKVIRKYQQYGLIPRVIPPRTSDQPTPNGRTPTQHETDRALLRRLAARYGYQFYVAPSLVPFENTAYWGPPERAGLPQPALTIGMGPNTNVDSAEFRFDALDPETVDGWVQEPGTAKARRVQVTSSTLTSLTKSPTLTADKPNTRRRLLQSSDGLTYSQARGRAQGSVDASTEDIAVGTGELDATRYGSVLRARSLVGVRGAGPVFDGTYSVQQVEHDIKRGQYRQRFVVTRDGTGARAPGVRV
jgi:hypothetical protein